MSRALRLLGSHWYVPAFAAMLVGCWLFARNATFMASGGEAALLIDLCLTAPLLYLLCYARRQPLRVSLIRARAIACGGIWLASWLIPAGQQHLLGQLAPWRWAGLGVVALFEVAILVAAIRIAFSATGTTKELTAATGAPEWVSRLMLWEARLWRGLWHWLSGRRP
jgi:hypothetical protein